MNKLFSLIKACMTSDMQIFKVKKKSHNGKSNITLPLLLAFFLMFTMWSNANMIFEKVTPMGLTNIVLTMAIFMISIMTLVEGIYKCNSLIFKCRDDQLLLSLPIKRSTVLFVKIFKFYVFELLFNSLFIFPVMLAYIRWAPSISWTYYLTSMVMLLLLPVIPIVISTVLGMLFAGLASRFKYKNIVQILLPTIFLIFVYYFIFNSDGVFNYIVEHATSINDIISKLYYPAGAYLKMITDFRFIDLLLFIIVNLVILGLMIFLLSKVYFKVNSRLTGVRTSKRVNINDLVIKKRSITSSLIDKELNTFFKTPVFIVNAGFALVLFMIVVILIYTKFDIVLGYLTIDDSFQFNQKLIMDNLSILVFALISLTAFMTSITNSVISLEGRNITILKALPVKPKTILMSKIYAALVITTPVLIIGDILLFIKFKIKIIEAILLVLLSILIPLVSHFIGLIVNLKYPKLDAENSTEIVKQSTSSLVSVMLGMFFLVLNMAIISKIIGNTNAILILIGAFLLYIIIDISLYLYLIKQGVKKFRELSI